ncbi:MAG: hypothetical protein ABIU11_04865 [Chitinophagaceae bacterium]
MLAGKNKTTLAAKGIEFSPFPKLAAFHNCSYFQFVKEIQLGAEHIRQLVLKHILSKLLH